MFSFWLIYTTHNYDYLKFVSIVVNETENKQLFEYSYI